MNFAILQIEIEETVMRFNSFMIPTLVPEKVVPHSTLKTANKEICRVVLD